VLKKLGWDKDLTEAEMAVINKVNLTTSDAVSLSLDLSGGIQRVALMPNCSKICSSRSIPGAWGWQTAYKETIAT
jgi:formate dehydrogenase major subunit